MVSTTESITENSTTDVVMLVNLKKPIARNSLSQFLALLDAKQKTADRILRTARNNGKAINMDSALWYRFHNRRVHTKSIASVKNLYNWVLHHTHVVHSPTDNDCLKMPIDGQTGKTGCT